MLEKIQVVKGKQRNLAGSPAPREQAASKREFWKASTGPESRSARRRGRDSWPVLATNVDTTVVFGWCLPFCKTLSEREFCKHEARASWRRKYFTSPAPTCAA